MKDYACERIYRDARITSIYEGTTQLQVVAAIRHVTTGTYLHQIEAYEAAEIAPELEPLRDRLKAMKAAYVKAVETVTATKDNEYIDFQARRMVEMAGHVIMGHLCSTMPLVTNRSGSRPKYTLTSVRQKLPNTPHLSNVSIPK